MMPQKSRVGMWDAYGCISKEFWLYLTSQLWVNRKLYEKELGGE